MRRALVVVALLVVGCGDDDPIAAARAEATDTGAFGTGLEAGQTLARVAEHLDDALRACDRDAAAGDGDCPALGTASGYAQVLAASVVRCTAPGRDEARRAMVAVLDALVAGDLDDPPPLPDC